MIALVKFYFFWSLKTKDRVVDVFKDFHIKVEREIGQNLKCIRSNNVREYVRPFDEYCSFHGIHHEIIVPRTVQHNSIAKRMNHTIIGKARCMLSLAKLPKNFWDEAMRTTVDLINLSPYISLGDDVVGHA